ncbi:Signal transduction histidine kinase [Malonomonas rubra DSM 5091]|uniref:histidine kinase n=1 Tax=Malonomonas rubra DSM 5091 TaxID=1122189 RepID=A0A1M6H5P7_MALRU|nr:ATP-binding protein [Malonomonas rubra]SHJ17493.1 Signal transduction histidine kinase [Malonomonas rubra DSM 5091]
MTYDSEQMTPKISDLISYGEAISPDTLVSVLSERFYNEPELDALPIVKDGYPYGLATRSKILTTLAIRFGFALYGKKPISVIADMTPMIVHIDESLNGVLDKAMARDFNDIYDEILVVDDEDKYVGRLSVKRLVVEQGNYLASSIAQRELAIARAKEMEKLDAVKTSFMAHITHELRSPIGAIIGFSELLQMRHNDGKRDDVPKYLSLLSSNAQNLRAIVNNILDLSKIEAGRMEIHSEEFSLCELLAEVLETCKVLAGDKPLQIEIDCPDPSIKLQADRIKTRQILLNLASNAVKYSDRGIIVISAEVTDQLHLAVKDTGIGIKKENLERLFTAFDQLEDAKTRRFEGTGLGLTITRQLIQLLGGAISVESTYGVGSRFDVSLPCTTKPKLKVAS